MVEMTSRLDHHRADSGTTEEHALFVRGEGGRKEKERGGRKKKRKEERVFVFKRKEWRTSEQIRTDED
jgi:hypothetical protein